MRTVVVPGHINDRWLTEEGWKTADQTRQIEGVVVFRPANPAAIEDAEARGDLLELQELDRLTAPDSSVVVRMAEYMGQHGLSVEPPSAAGLYLTFRGPIGSVTAAFRCTFASKLLDGRDVYLNREEPQVPEWAAPHVLAIIGLENRSQAHPNHRYPSRSAHPANGGQGYYPAELKTAYNWPTDLTGAGETIGLLEFSNGFSVQDVTAFWQEHGLPVRDVAFVSVDGTPNDGGVAAVDMECTLDIEWAGAMAPQAALVVYEASSGSSDRAFGVSMLRGLEAALSDTVHAPSVLSISYGDAESHFPVATLHAWDQAAARLGLRGVTVLAASGDAGAYGIRGGTGRPVPHADTPGSVPHIVAVGGTTLTLNAEHQRESEVGWSDTNHNGASGGGVSIVFAQPGWQKNADVPLNPEGGRGRGLPDVALVADPDTGVNVIFQGQSSDIGGTSASCPMWAGLIALANQARVRAGKGRLGFMNPVLYAFGGTATFHDIVQGNNSIDGVAGYSCGPGWDAVTGWGTPDAHLLVQALLGG
jgi:kumamolisin